MTVGEGRPVLLRARWSRKWSAFAAVVSAVLGSLAAWMALAPGDSPGWVRVLAGVVAVALAAGVARSVSTFLNPPVLFEADERGLCVYRDGLRYGGPGFLVPWSRVKGLDLRTRRLLSGGTHQRVRTIAVQVRCDDEWSPPPSISHHPDGTRDTIHLDAGSCTPGGEELLEGLRGILKRYGP